VTRHLLKHVEVVLLAEIRGGVAADKRHPQIPPAHAAEATRILLHTRRHP
jgi:hypothetical protein